MLTDEQLLRYDQIVQEYERELEELSQARRQRIEEAVERTKEILTPRQVEKYEELRKHMAERMPGRGRRSRGPSTTEPSDAAPGGDDH